MNLQQTTTLLAACTALTAFSTSAQEQYYDFGFIGASGAYGQSVYSDNGGGSLSLEPNLFYNGEYGFCLLYTSPSPRDPKISRMPSSA